MVHHRFPHSSGQNLGDTHPYSHKTQLSCCYHVVYIHSTYIYIYLEATSMSAISPSHQLSGDNSCAPQGHLSAQAREKGSPYVGHWVVQRFGISYQLTLVAEPPKRGSAGQAIRGFFERHGRCKQWFCGWKHKNVLVRTRTEKNIEDGRHGLSTNS